MLTTKPSNPRRRVLLSAAGVLVALAAACSSRMATDSVETTATAPRVKPKVRIMPSGRFDGQFVGVIEPASTPNAIARTDTITSKREPSNVYFEFQVERQAQQLPGTGQITYPPELKAAHVEGEVLAQFVLDTLGVAEPGSLKILKSSHAQFSDAVRDGLPTLRFKPAEIGGRKVKQLVQQPFTFALPK